jgi:Pentapeptide repeats (9 copies)
MTTSASSSNAPEPSKTQVGWRTCKEEGCIGIRLLSGRCLAHTQDQDRQDAFDQVTLTGIVDARGVTIDDSLLEQILTALPQSTDNLKISRGARFDSATFTGNARFGKVHFSGEAGFLSATFAADANFGGAIFDLGANFLGATFHADVDFRDATFRSGAMFFAVTFHADAKFAGATFHADAVFGTVTFHADAKFAGATFHADAVFLDTKFRADADFAKAIFTGYAGFDEATFTGNAWFSDVAFHAAAGFDRVTFKRFAAFAKASFTGDAMFSEATFQGFTWFGEATFTGYAEFSLATFTDDVRFAEATFADDVKFAQATFDCAKSFGPVLVRSSLNLDDVRFGSAVRIEASTPVLYCQRARFSSGVEFRLRWARIVMDDSDLSAPSLITGVPRLSSDKLVQKERQAAEGWQQELSDRPSEQPRLLSLRRANVAGLGLSNVNLGECLFAGAHNLDLLRLDAAITLMLSPARAGWERRQVIAEEIQWRTTRGQPGRWTALQRPDWADDLPDPLDAGAVAALYRALRKGREDAKDEPGAADFYYGEMEMRRHTSGPLSEREIGSRGRVDRVVLTVYWVVSGYGLRAWRAFTWLAAAVAMFGLMFHLFGFSKPPQPAVRVPVNPVA